MSRRRPPSLSCSFTAHLLAGCVLFGSGLACAPPHVAVPYPDAEPAAGEAAEPELGSTEVRFAERRLDLQPFLSAFPYGPFFYSEESEQLRYLHRGTKEEGGNRLLELSEGSWEAALLSLEEGKELSGVDWSTRSLWSLHEDVERGWLWLHADGGNDERMNLWRMERDPQGGWSEPAAHSEADYVYAWGFSEDHNQVAYLAREGRQAPYKTCLRVKRFEGSVQAEDREILCDTPELSFTWGSILFSPDGRELYFSALVEGQRRRAQLVRVRLGRGPKAKVELLTDPERPRSTARRLQGWSVDPKPAFFYLSDEQGWTNLIRYEPSSRKSLALTSFQEELISAIVLEDGVLLSHGDPSGSTVTLIDPQDGTRIAHAALPGRVQLHEADGRDFFWTAASPHQVFELNRGRVEGQEGARKIVGRPAATLPESLAAATSGCKVRAVKVPSFSSADAPTALPEEFHAFLLEPAKIPPEPRLAMIRSFYGGASEWNRFDQIMCAAGITILSPAVRGSSGFGADFAALNNGDLGGDEIVDLFAAGRWLAQELDLQPEQIGVYGRSHGGYATMRALTFPLDDPRWGPRFEFGFGLADAGFSDIAAFYAATNIPDWVIQEAGDPGDPEDAQRLRARSPLYSPELLQAPIFMSHGAEDWRVPVEGSRAFAKAATEKGGEGAEVVYVEVAGQGHRVQGLAATTELFRQRFAFLEARRRGLAKAEGDSPSPAGADASGEAGQ